MKNVRLLGLPTDRNSSYLRGCSRGPAAVRALMAGDMMNLAAENGLELGRDFGFEDGGDVLLSEQGQHQEIVLAVTRVIQEARVPLVLGGDHSVTYPIVQALARQHGPLTILHVDAHPDLYPEYNGNRLSHACPFARIMEEGLATRLVQIGVRTCNKLQRQQAERFGVEMLPPSCIDLGPLLPLTGPLYISIDLDGLDPACAPGVSHHEPGGLTVRQLLSVLQKIEAEVVGCDIVEYNPDRDIQQMTAAVVLKLLKELAVLSATVR